jgi:L-fuculose-phosphate aldolase
METIEHFAKISLVARVLGGERVLTQQEVERLQGLRDHYGIKAPAPICPEPSEADQVECQTIEAPVVPGRQLVDDTRLAGIRRGNPVGSPAMGPDTEIRLTYRELTALIEDAIKNLTT